MSMMQHWTGGPEGGLNVIATLTAYLIVYVSSLFFCLPDNSAYCGSARLAFRAKREVTHEIHVRSRKIPSRDRF